MAVSFALSIRTTLSDAQRWSFAAFVLAAVGLACSIWFILGSDSDPAQVRWWLVAFPLVVTPIPVLLPRHGVRAAVMVALGGWCLLTGFSIGMLLLPALFAGVLAVVRNAE